ncbi:hypothetical protein KW782_00015 [Candidatus Parcubacteria bacterium]|nr:hypothetical protein [Candidatus Parcubacteria bacterium]
MLTAHLTKKRSQLVAQIAEIDRLDKRLSRIKLDRFKDEPPPLEFGDTFVGIMPDDVKRLFVLYIRTKTLHDNVCRKIKAGSRRSVKGVLYQPIHDELVKRAAELLTILMLSLLEVIPALAPHVNSPADFKKVIFGAGWMVFLRPTRRSPIGNPLEGLFAGMGRPGGGMPLDQMLSIVGSMLGDPTQGGDFSDGVGDMDDLFEDLSVYGDGNGRVPDSMSSGLGASSPRPR